MLWLYSSIIWFLYNILKLLPSKNKKLKSFVIGRKNWEKKLSEWKKKNDKKNVIWMHVSSLGEYYQGIPVLDRLFKEYGNNYCYLTTFFSPSGYESVVKKELYHYSFYLPIDTKRNSKLFLDILKPELVIFVKYDYWPNFLLAIKKRDINCILIAALFRKSQIFFKWYGSVFRSVLNSFSNIYTQNWSSLYLLKTIGIDSEICGDPRIDDTLKRKNSVGENVKIKEFKGISKVIIIGSCWQEDLDVVLEPLIGFLKDNNEWKLIFAPHDYTPIYESRVNKELKAFDEQCIKYTDIDRTKNDARVLLIDIVGILFGAYQYGDIAIIGGSFGVGLHNIMEPSVFQLPILFGDKCYNKFQEAIDLIELKSTFLISNSTDCRNILNQLGNDKSFRKKCGQENYKYMLQSQGAAEKIAYRVIKKLN